MHAAADSGCNETAQLMCERSNHGLCRLQRQSWHCGDARVMDVLLGLMHRWRWRGELYIPVCPSVGRNLSELSAGDLSQPDFSGVWMPTSAVWAFLVKLTPNSLTFGRPSSAHDPPIRPRGPLVLETERTRGVMGSAQWIKVYAETAVALSRLCQTCCSTGPTKKTQDAVPVRATAVRIAKAQ